MTHLLWVLLRRLKKILLENFDRLTTKFNLECQILQRKQWHQQAVTVVKSKLSPMEVNDARCPSLEMKFYFHPSRYFHSSRRRSQTNSIDHSNAFVRKHLFQYGQGDNNILSVGKSTGCVREKVLLLKVDTDPTIIQHEGERDGSSNIPHQYLLLGLI